MIAVMVAAFALMGAPTGTPVSCDSSLPSGGLTSYEPTTVTLGYAACGATRIAARRPRVLSDLGAAIVGEGLLVALHEAAHASGTADETDAECRALATLPAMLARYLTARDARNALRHARGFDRSMPLMYHEHACGATP